MKNVNRRIAGLKLNLINLKSKEKHKKNKMVDSTSN